MLRFDSGDASHLMIAWIRDGQLLIDGDAAIGKVDIGTCEGEDLADPGAGVDCETENDPRFPVMVMCISEQCLYFMLAQSSEFLLTCSVFARFVGEVRDGGGGHDMITDSLSKKCF